MEAEQFPPRACPVRRISVFCYRNGILVDMSVFDTKKAEHNCR